MAEMTPISVKTYSDIFSVTSTGFTSGAETED
jgi:hypothetical protein